MVRLLVFLLITAILAVLFGFTALASLLGTAVKVLIFLVLVAIVYGLVFGGARRDA